MTPWLEVLHLSCTRGNQQVLCDLSLTMKKGEIACLLGPSGSGKTTLLRCLGGLEKPEAGKILLNGRLLNDGTSSYTEPEHRRVGMVFQESTLFPHQNLRQNICFGIHQRDKAMQNFPELTSLLGIDHLLSRFPHEVSGGQRQRAALGRALLRAPDLLLMDEPFSHLDSRIKRELLHSISNILRGMQTTTLMVTHSCDDAFDFADTIGVLLDQKICHWSGQEEVYYRPGSKKTAEFLGIACLVKGEAAGGTLHTFLGEMRQENTDFSGPCEVLILPEKVHMDKSRHPNATVIARFFRGTHFVFHIILDDDQTIYCASMSGQNQDFKAGQRIRASSLAKEAYALPLSEQTGSNS